MTKHEVAVADEAEFQRQAQEMVDALRACAGHLATRVGRSVDEPTEWLVVSEWENIGSYRRALSSFDVRIRAVPLLSTARDEPSAFEILLDGETGSKSSDLAK